MYKNKIKNKLQKIYNRGAEAFPDRPRQPLERSDSCLASSRRGKLSLSKDLSIASNSSTHHHGSNHKQHSFSQSKKAYIRLVSTSAKKDLACLSNSKICITNEGISERAQKRKENTGDKNLFFENGEKQRNHGRNNSAFELRNMAINIAKSAAILNQKIVPILLQAATLSSKIPNNVSFEDNLASMFLGSTTEIKEQKNHNKDDQKMLQTPINHLKNQSFDQIDQFQERRTIMNRCETQPSNPSAQKYKNRHKIEHSPAPIKNKSPHKQSSTPNSHTKKYSQTNKQELNISTADFTAVQADISLHPLARELELINCKRKAVQNRISKKLDELSNRANSMAKQYNIHSQNEQHPKKPKILMNATKTNVLCSEKAGNSAQKYNHQDPENDQNAFVHQKVDLPSSRSKNMRNVIMSRIFS